MKVIVDSNVWSQAFRAPRKQQPSPQHSKSTDKLKDLISSSQAVMLGIVRQEVLSGIKTEQWHLKVQQTLRAFPNAPIEDEHYETAASFFNTCRRRGIQGSHTDFLICACSMHWNYPILTEDQDFTRYAKHLPIELY